MTTRRGFIQAAGVACVATAGANPNFASATSPSTLAFHRVLTDSSMPAGRVFAAEAARLGARVHDTRGDPSGVYLETLLPAWKSELAPIAGLTNYASMFALSLLAEGAGLRVIYRGHHVAEGGGFRHQLFGPAAITGALVTPALDARPAEAWAGSIARVVMNWPLSEVTIRSSRSNIAVARKVTVQHGDLVSWVMAPVRA